MFIYRNSLFYNVAGELASLQVGVYDLAMLRLLRGDPPK
jgi:hypothetical protein